MTKLEDLGTVVETDVLVLGGGISGLWAANRAKEFVDNVLVVDRGAPIGRSGQGYFSMGFIQVLPPGEDIDEYVRAMVYLSDGLCEQDRFEKVFRESFDRIKDYQELGVEFRSDQSGNLLNFPQRGLKHNASYVGTPFGHGGKAMTEALAGRAEALGVRYINRITITDLIKQEGRVVGALGFNIRDGRFFIFRAGATILCTGACSLKSPYEDQLMATGNGYEIALKAGAEVKRAEFAMMWIMPKHFRWEGITALLPLGAEFVNEKGERFMDRYSPHLKSNCDYAFIVRAMAIEAMEGRGPFYLDCSRMTPENKDLMTPQSGWAKLQYDRLLEEGIRPFEEKQEWIQCMAQIAASVDADMEMRTCVPGLFAAGSLAHIETGVHVGGMSLLPCTVLGRCAGESAAKYALSEPLSRIDSALVMDKKQDCFHRLGTVGLNPETIITDILDIIYPYDVSVLKNEASLKKALGKIKRIRDELLPSMDARDLHYLAKSKDVQSMALMAEMFLKASLMRTESRASHYRIDYPDRDDKNWLKWILFGLKDGSLSPRTKNLPLDQYRFKTWDCYSDNFKFPDVSLAGPDP